MRVEQQSKNIGSCSYMRVRSTEPLLHCFLLCFDFFFFFFDQVVMLHMQIFADMPLYHELYLEYKFALLNTATHWHTLAHTGILAHTYCTNLFLFLVSPFFACFFWARFYLVSMLQVHCFRSCGTYSIAPHKWLATTSAAQILVIWYVY